MKANSKMVDVLDTTLRDGSYVIDFQFTVQDTVLIATALERAGISLIEIGHGLGLGASKKTNMSAAASDTDYLECMAHSIRSARWGMFCIPGIASLEDLELAAQYQMPFVRIGTNVGEIEKAAPFIQKARELNMHVSANLMKTYCLSPEEVAQQTVKAERFGAQVVCIVDSAGGMLPNEVQNYMQAIQAVSSIPLGFHGHNNLGLANANTLIAIENGAAVVDTSIRGMGRSAGNAVTEIIFYLLKRLGSEHYVHISSLLNLAERIIDPILRNHQQLDSLAIVSGYAQFHSSYLETVLQYAQQYQVDPRELIIRSGKTNPQDLPKNIIQSLAEELAHEQAPNKSVESSIQPHFYLSAEPEHEIVWKEILNKAKIQARQHRRPLVLNLVQNWQNPVEIIEAFHPTVHMGPLYVVLSAEVSKPEQIDYFLSNTAADIDYLLLDTGLSTSLIHSMQTIAHRYLSENKIICYSDLDIWARALSAVILEQAGVQRQGSVWVYGTNQLAELCCHHLRLQGFSVDSLQFSQVSSITDRPHVFALLACERLPPNISTEQLKAFPILVDGILNAYGPDLIQSLYNLGKQVLRPEMPYLIHAEIESRLRLRNLYHNKTRSTELEGISVCIPGIIAPYGTVIVDKLPLPEKVLGIANGFGSLMLPHEMNQENIQTLQKIKTYIRNELLA